MSRGGALAVGVVVAITGAPGGVRADAGGDADARPAIKPDPRAVTAAREANLEPESVREGFAIGIAVGPSMQVGLGIGNATGSGGGFDLRLGTVASPRWVWLVELAATAYSRDGIVNQSAVASFGGQLYLKEALWLRGGAGFSTFTRRDATMETQRFNGLGLLGAGGIDLFRRRGLALSSEVATTLAFYQGGRVMGVALQLGASWY